jgi:hypothetical protein
MADVYNSKLAKFLKWWKKENNYAITTSKNCCRYSCDKEIVDDHPKWRKHEETHKAQFARMGWFNFIFSYILENIMEGYNDNRFEIEARKEAEKH